MRPYNVEVFSRDFTLRHHTNVNYVNIEEDYLSPQNNNLTLLIGDGIIIEGDYIWITRSDTTEKYFGVVTAVNVVSPLEVKVSFTTFLNGIFETRILFDTDLQGQGTLESALASIITANWISTSDNTERIPGLSCTTTSSTSSWGFNLKSEKEKMHHCIINFYDSIIAPAMKKYRIRMVAVPNFQTKSITLSIGTNADDVFLIDADLPNVLERQITIMETDDTTNKLVVYNKEDYSQSRTYYLHPDGTYNMTNNNRIFPVVRMIKSTEAEYNTDDTVKKSFATMADEEAADLFGGISYNNNIELKVLKDDALIHPLTMGIGQRVIIYNQGKSHNSILTATKIEDNIVTLTFGTIRLDLTKLIRR